MKANAVLLWLCLLVAASPALAQPPPPGPPGHDAVGEHLFPPELVMAHQNAINLTPEQKTYLREEIRKAQFRFTELQWQLQDAVETLGGLLGQDRVEEQQVLAQLEKVLEAERQIKQTQLTLMVRIKNKLTPEQQARLRELRAKAPPAPPQPPDPGGPPPGPNQP